jgi:beta-lactamase regulating signal transducer with metallopeptidase domain
MDVSLVANMAGEIAVRATVLLLVALGTSALLRRGPAELRRRLWAGTVVALLLLPAVSLALPRLRVKVMPVAPAALPPAPGDVDAWFWSKEGWGQLLQPPAGNKAGPTSEQTSSSPPLRAELSTRESALRVLAGLYLAGFALFATRLLRARRQASRLLRDARPADPAWPPLAGVDLRESDQVELPITVGSLRPVVLVPTAGRTWLPAWQRAVLAHEAAHVRAADPLLQLLAELAGVLYWFHPLVHLAVRKLRTERELAADDAALATGMPASQYANLLFELACLPGTPPVRGAVVPLLTPSGLKTRVIAALDAGRRRVTTRTAGLAILGAGLLAFVPVALALPALRDGEAPLPLGRGQLVGQAVDDAGRPMPGAEVHFRLFSYPPLTASVKADDGGWFRYPWDTPAVSEFAVYVRTSKDGLAARHSVLNVPFGTRLPLKLPLRPAATLAGTVRDARGAPLAGAEVRVWHDERTAFGPGRALVVRTDARGQWQLPGMLYGGYRLLVTAPSGVLAYQWVNLQDKDIRDLETVVPGEQPVTGHLLDDRGRPLGGVRINEVGPYLMTGGTTRGGVLVALEERGPQLRFIDYDVTAADGSFRLLPRGLVNIPVRAAGPDGTVYFGSFDDAGLRRHQTQGHRQVDVRLTPGVRVSGVVRTSTGQPMNGAVVSFEPQSFEATEPAFTGPDGTFSLWVPRRDVVLYATKYPYAHHDQPQARGALALGADPTGIELVVSP